MAISKKICSKCKVLKSIKEFYIQKTKHGFCLTGACKKCSRKASKQYNHEHAVQKSKYDKRRWRENIVENRYKGRIIAREHYKNNIKRVQIRNRIVYYLTKLSVRNVPTKALMQLWEILKKISKMNRIYENN